MRISLVLVGISLCAAFGLAAAAHSGQATSNESTGPPVVDCTTRSQVVPAREHPGRIRPSILRRSVVAGPVVILGAKQWADYPGRPKPGIRIPVKSPMIVDAGAAVTISLAEESEQVARIVVGLDQKPYEFRTDAVTLEPCPPDATVAGRRVGRRTPFLGGFRLHGPTCVSVTVTPVEDPEPIAREIAFGASCDKS